MLSALLLHELFAYTTHRLQQLFYDSSVPPPREGLLTNVLHVHIRSGDQ
jgi:hypothetical protein